MKKLIVFLRGINVGGGKKILMRDLTVLLENQGFNDVTTYIQSGNILLSSEEKPIKIKEKIEKAIKVHYAFDVDVFVIEPHVLENLLSKCPFLKTEQLNKLYFVLLAEIPSEHQWENLIHSDFGAGNVSLYENMIYLYCPDGYGKSKLNNNYIESKLKFPATTRNLNTINKMIDLSKRY